MDALYILIPLLAIVLVAGTKHLDARDDVESHAVKWFQSAIILIAIFLVLVKTNSIVFLAATTGTILTIGLILREMSANFLSTCYLYLFPPCSAGTQVTVPEFPNTTPLMFDGVGFLRTPLKGYDTATGKPVTVLYANLKLAGGHISFWKNNDNNNKNSTA